MNAKYDPPPDYGRTNQKKLQEVVRIQITVIYIFAYVCTLSYKIRIVALITLGLMLSCGLFSVVLLV